MPEPLTAPTGKLQQRYKMLWRWGCVGGYATCIFMLSAIPGDSLPHVRLSDKLMHAGEFGLLCLLLCRAWRVSLPTWSHAAIALGSILTAIAYGVLDECHQLFVAQRTAEIADLAADSLGAVLAAWGWYAAGKHWSWLP